MGVEAFAAVYRPGVYAFLDLIPNFIILSSDSGSCGHAS